MHTYDVPGIDAKSIQKNIVTTTIRPLVSEGIGFFHALHILPNFIRFIY